MRIFDGLNYREATYQEKMEICYRRFKKFFRKPRRIRLIKWLYRRYVNAIYVPYDAEFYLDIQGTATVDPKLKLKIHTKNSERYHDWSIKQLLEQGIEIRRKK